MINVFHGHPRSNKPCIIIELIVSIWADRSPRLPGGVSAAGFSAGSRSRNDDPEMDGTDFAHPAWWRGNEHAFLVAVHEVNDILDGTASNVGINIEPWQSLRQRLYDIRTLLGIAERIVGNTKRSLSVDQWYKVRNDYAERLLNRGYCGKCGDSKPECKCK